MTKAHAVGLCALIWLGASCSFDASIPVVDSGLPEIVCHADADCPSGWLCNPNSRCIPVAQRDSEAPALDGSPVLTPAIGGVGQLFGLTFKVSEALGQDPVVDLDVGDNRAASWILDEEATDREGLSYAFRYVATGNEPEGARLTTIDLTDLSGNGVDNLSAGSLVLDFTRPRVMSADLTPAFAAAAIEVRLDLELSEPLPAPPTLVLVNASGDSHTFAHVAASGTLGHAYAFTPSGQEAEGLYLVQATGEDAAGNLLDEPQVAKLVMDFTAPGVTASRVVPDLARAGQRVLVEIDLSEDLASWGPLAATASSAATHFYNELGGTSERLRFEHTVASGTDGHYLLELRDLVDLAGNATSLLVVGSVEYDSVPPALGNLTTDAAVYSARAGHNLIAAQFDVGEALADDQLELQIGDRVFGCGGYQVNPPNYHCTYTVDGTEPEGLAIVAVRATDGAGNESVASIPVRLDFTAPALVPDTAELLLTPPPGCPLTGVTRWTDGASARVLFVLDEPVGAVPTVSTISPEVIAFEHRSGSVTSFAFEKTLAGEAQQQGAHALQADVVDQVGNSTALALDLRPPLEVDTAAPTLLVDQAAVCYVRSPWGNAAAEDVGGFTVPAGPYYALAPADPLSGQSALPAATFVLDEGAPRLLQVWADSERGSLLGSTAANADGTWPRLRLTNLDAPGAFVDGVDSACNVSAPVRLENAEWVATPRPPAYGVSPHLVRVSSLVLSSLQQDPLMTRPAGDAAAGSDGTALFASTGSSWRIRTTALDLPSGRYGVAMAYDSARGRVVLFGGYNREESMLPDTWEWDGQAWSERTPPLVNPSARMDHAMAYDSVRGRVVLFGGYDLNWTDVQDTWEWDGETWTDVTPADSPPARYGPAMAFDSGRGRVVMFGGSGLQDTWEWDGRSWIDVTPADSPPGRLYHAMAYDSARNRVVMFGGSGYRQDTWEWDGVRWEERTPATTTPPAREIHAMAYDEVRGRVVLFGGSSSHTTMLWDTWEWDGQDWFNRTQASNHPPNRDSHGMVFDSGRGRIVLFGGTNIFNDWQDTWEWDGQVWADRMAASTVPSGRDSHAMTYDSDRRRVVMFGGDYDGSRLQDTWEWDGYAWAERTLASGNPPRHMFQAMAYDSARKRVVMFGGCDATWNEVQDTWEWDGRVWVERTLASGNPPARGWHDMAFDSVRNVVVMFGGWGGSADLQDTWEWDGQTWNDVTPASSPPARSEHAMAFDSDRGLVVMFGGNGSRVDFADTWEWDGQGWTEVTPASSPPSRGSDMVYDSGRKQVILFGGTDGYDLMQDTWEWDGQLWVETTPASGNPAARAYLAMAYDSVRGRTVLYGGLDWDHGLSFGDTWEYLSGAGLQPAVQFTVDATVAGLAPAAVNGLRVRAHCGGIFSPFGAGDVGATLLGWATSGPGLPPGSWHALAANAVAASSTAPHLPAPPASLIDWSATTAQQARAYLLESDRTLNFQCRPSGISEAHDATVALDYIEVRVRYQAP
ncbi:MAG: hypothetical protein JXR83_13995 [Deltaproteobacteria bacterium]|nr:hypothetical protein [Deltaproteobacteria bacterium]